MSSPRRLSIVRTATGLALAALSTVASASAFAGPDVATWDEPSLDRWFYPFNTTPGTRAVMPLFGATGAPLFDDRDGQVFLRWDTTGQVEPGLGPAAYDIISVTVTITNATDGTVAYDPTLDPFTAYLDPKDPEFTEDDPGSPLELFGAAGRNGFDPITFLEDGPYSVEDPINTDVRNIKSISFDDGSAVVDVNNSVRDRFTPVPWAIGTTGGVEAGDPVPGDAVFTFTLDLTRPGVHAYVAAGLDAGALPLLVTSLQRVVQQGGDFLTAYSKESIEAQLDLVDAATLEIVWQLAEPPACPADVDGTGNVDFSDLLAVLADFGDCSGCAADIDGDGTVDFADLLEVLAAFGPCPA